MKQTVLFIAMSLDGYIADMEGNVGWLEGHKSGEDNMESYKVFRETIDTVVMGWKTYHQISTELFPGEWVYKGMTSYVITHKKCVSSSEIVFADETPCKLIEKLKQEEGKDIWVCGGANIAGQLIRENLIDKYHISIIPVILGRGIRLFEGMDTEIKLKLINTKSYNGITDLVYERR